MAEVACTKPVIASSWDPILHIYLLSTSRVMCDKSQNGSNWIDRMGTYPYPQVAFPSRIRARDEVRKFFDRDHHFPYCQSIRRPNCRLAIMDDLCRMQPLSPSNDVNQQSLAATIFKAAIKDRQNLPKESIFSFFLNHSPLFLAL